MRAKQKFHTIRVKNWNVNLDIAKMSNRTRLASFSSFKLYMKKNYPEIIEKHRLKSKLVKSKGKLKILKIVAWDSVLEQAIDKELLTKFLNNDRRRIKE